MGFPMMREVQEALEASLGQPGSAWAETPENANSHVIYKRAPKYEYSKYQIL